MRGDLIPILLFLWINGISVVPCFTFEIRCNPPKTCPKGFICALEKDGEFGQDTYFCVKAGRCEGQSGGQCPGDQVCQQVAEESYVCKELACPEGSGVICPTGFQCKGRTDPSGVVSYFCARRPVCGGTTNGDCPSSGEMCEDHGPPGDPSYSCERARARCWPQNLNACPGNQMCKGGSEDAQGFCEEPPCDGQCYGKCYGKKICKSETLDGSGPYSCVNRPTCGGKSDGTCLWEFQKCTARGKGKKTTYHCEAGQP